MTTTLTQTFNRDDIRRVYASFAADYRIVAEWTELHSAEYIDQTIAAVKAVAEEQYLKEVHLQLRSSTGAIRQAAAYRVSANAAGWSTDRPGDLYWDSNNGDYLQLIVFYTQKWSDLSQAERDAFRALHMPGWGPSDFDGSYGSMSGSTDRRYASRAYGMERTRYS
jgi:HORMA domain-containing protein